MPTTVLITTSLAAHVKTVTVIGRRWFDRTYGNTYFSAQILIDGVPVEGIDYEYGYGDQYAWEAIGKAEKAGLIPPREEGEPNWMWAERTGIALHCAVSDVSRKRDL